MYGAPPPNVLVGTGSEIRPREVCYITTQCDTVLLYRPCTNSHAEGLDRGPSSDVWLGSQVLPIILIVVQL